MKILYVTTVGATMNFFTDFIEALITEGHTVDIATNDSVIRVSDRYRELGCRVFTLPCSRSLLRKGNLDSIKAIKKLVKAERYDIVHCHTPIAAACTRLACRKLRKTCGVKVFYTAHGFHFYKGAPFKNWLLYYPVEKLCSRFTDVLITINREDFAIAQKKLHAKKTEYVAGVGIDIAKFDKAQVDQKLKRQELGIPEDAILFTTVGELGVRKNQKVMLEALAKTHDERIHYALVGMGALTAEYERFARENNISHRVHLLGFRRDVAEIYKASDVCCLPSFQEGLPVSVMEAMACGLPVICSRIRGNTDLIDASGGILFEPADIQECYQAVVEVLKMDLKQLGSANRERAENYSIEKITLRMKNLYESCV